MFIPFQIINDTRDMDNLSRILTDPAYLTEGEILHLECWTCARRRKLDGTPFKNGAPFIISKAAKSVHWITVVDFLYKRHLAFCSQACAEAARRKDGQFKKRRPK